MSTRAPEEGSVQEGDGRITKAGEPTIHRQAEANVRFVIYYAGFCEDPHWQDHYPGNAAFGIYRECQDPDSGLGWHPSHQATASLRRQTAEGRAYPVILQCPEGVDYPCRSEIRWW